MNSKAKAKELVDRFEKFNKGCDCLEYMCVCFHLGLEERKAFALICVDEMIETATTYSSDELLIEESEEKLKELEEVKQEIESYDSKRKG